MKQLMWVLAALVITAVVGCHRHAAGDTGGDDTLRVAVEFSPLTYYFYDDTLGGYDHDLMLAVAARGGRQVAFMPFVTLADALDDLAAGRCDVLIAQFPVTQQAREHFIFTEPLYIDRQVLVQRDDSLVAHSVLDLAGDTVHVVAHSPMVERLHSLAREIGDSIIVVEDPLYGPEQLVMMVASGEIRYAAVNRTIATDLARRVPNLNTALDVSMSQFQAWVLAPADTVLRDSLNAWLAATPTARLRQRYHLDTK